MRVLTIAVTIAASLTCGAPCASSQTLSPTVTAALDESQPAKYLYTVANPTKKTITAIVIGMDQFNQQCTLRTAPKDWAYGKGMPETSVTVPSGWTARAFGDPNASVENWCIEFKAASGGIAPGETMSGLAIQVESPDSAYLDAPVGVMFSDGSAVFNRLQ